MKRFLILASILMAVTIPWSALAEVCDKERPDWNRADGRASLIDALIHHITSPMGVTVFLVFLLAILLRKRWLYGIASAVGVVPLGYISSGLVIPTTIHDAAVREGCIGHPVLTILLLLCASAYTAKKVIDIRPGKSH